MLWASQLFMNPGTEIPPALMLRGPFCLALDGFLLLPGILLPCLNNPISILNMQNTQHNLANQVFFENLQLLHSSCCSLGGQGWGHLCLCPKMTMSG